jgi:hypothetical protein
MGITIKFIIDIKPSVSPSLVARIKPNPVKVAQVRIIKTIDRKKPETPVSLTPIATAMPIMMRACMMAVVMPPRLLPNMMEKRLTGATSTSLRKPNSLSQMTDAPDIVAANNRVIPTMPGDRKSRKLMPAGIPGISLAGIKLNGSPRKARKRNGINIELARRAFTLKNLFICLSHMV